MVAVLAPELSRPDEDRGCGLALVEATVPLSGRPGARRPATEVAGTPRLGPQVYRRRRMAAGVVAAALVMGLWLVLHVVTGTPAPAPAVSGPHPVVGSVWTVRPGDTLWSIAAATPHHGDIRALVDELSAEVHGRVLQVGERLRVP